ncbi:MAG: phage holin [Ruminococcus sp.]|nr:phage holin [Ruminococcus sp.]
MKMSNKVYDIMKWIVMIVLPASATFYGLLAGTWGLPYADQIGTTITGLATFLGSVMMISTAKYNKQNSAQ